MRNWMRCLFLILSLSASLGAVAQTQQTMYLLKSNSLFGTAYDFQLGPQCPSGASSCESMVVGTVVRTNNSTAASAGTGDVRAYWVEYGTGWTASTKLNFENCMDYDPSCNISQYVKTGTTIFAFDVATQRLSINGVEKAVAWGSTGGGSVLPPLVGNPATQLVPPSLNQSIYTLTSGRLDPASVNVSATGTLGSATLSAVLNLGTGGLLRNAFSAGYSVYVGAMIPGRQVGAAAPVWFLLSGATGWKALSSPLTSFMDNVAIGAANQQQLIRIVSNTDITRYIGAEIYVGYGTSESEMMTSGRYLGIYKISQ